MHEDKIMRLSSFSCSFFLALDVHFANKFTFCNISWRVLFFFQSKEIGIQMHEELVKVTNELYTVSNRFLPHLYPALFFPLELTHGTFFTMATWPFA